MTTTSRVRTTAAAGSMAVAALLGLVAPNAGAAPADETSTTVATTAPETTTTTAPPAPAPEPAPAPAPAPGPVVLHYLPLSGPQLSKGASGGEVFLMQIHLVLRGYHVADGPAQFGEGTRHAVVAFQKQHGLPRTGVLDALTRFVLGASIEKPQPKVVFAGRGIEVDIARQIAIVSTNGVVDVIFDVSTGKRSTPTPRGSFRIQREINGLRVAKLGRLWRPKYFTGGYAFHGYSSIPNYNASSGCVRMYNPDIDYLWASGLAPVGTQVRIF